MTTTDEQYVPDEDEVRNLYVNHCDPAAVRDDDFNAEFDRFLARVRRDAARSALDGLARDVRDDWHRSHHWATQPIEEYRDTHYPEETP